VAVVPDFAVVIGMWAAHLPLAIVPIVLAFARIDSSVIRASQDLGAGLLDMFSEHRPALISRGCLQAFCSYRRPPSAHQWRSAAWRRRRIFH